jgi:hypothetical protein
MVPTHGALELQPDAAEEPARSWVSEQSQALPQQ